MKIIIHSLLQKPIQGGLAYWAVDCVMNNSICELQEGLG